MRKLMMFGALFLFFGTFGSLKQAAAAMDMSMDQPMISVKGEIIDTFCYLGMGAKGPGHKQCGIACAKAGTPVGIAEEGTGKIYILTSNKDKTPLPDAVINKMGEIATVKGKLYSGGGVNEIAVDSVE